MCATVSCWFVVRVAISGEGLNDSSFSRSSRSFSGGGTFGFPSTRFDYLRHKSGRWVWQKIGREGR